MSFFTEGVELVQVSAPLDAEGATGDASGRCPQIRGRGMTPACRCEGVVVIG